MPLPDPVPPPAYSAYDSEAPAPPPIAAPSRGGGWSWTPVAVKVLIGVVLLLAAAIGWVLVVRHVRPTVVAWSEESQRQALREQAEELLEVREAAAARQAAGALVHQGPQAVHAILEVAAVIAPDDSSARVHRTALRALAEFGPEILPVLEQVLAEGPANDRVAALEVLRQMGGPGAPLAARLPGLVSDPQRWVRVYACDALGQLGPATTEAVGALSAALGHTDAYTRRHAAEALGAIGAPAEGAVAALGKLAADDADRDVRQAAAVARQRIALPAAARDARMRATGELRELLDKIQGVDPNEATAALRGLQAKGLSAKEAAPVAALALQSPQAAVREAAADFLGTLGDAAGSYAFALRAAMEDPEPPVRDAAERALRRAAQ